MRRQRSREDRKQQPPLSFLSLQCCVNLLCLLQCCSLLLLFLFPDTFLRIVFPYFLLPTDMAPHVNGSSLVVERSRHSKAVSLTMVDPLAPYQASKLQPLKGVAVTLFLSSPKWFQARYTLMVQNILVNLPTSGRWKVQIFHTGKANSGLTLNRGLQRLVQEGLVELTLIPPKLLREKRVRKAIMTDVWFWESMLADRVLIFGGNSVICGNSPLSFDDFAAFEWIGAPWSHFSGHGGDGGFSFRSRPLMLRVIKRELSKYSDIKERELAWKSWGYEDQFFISRLLDMEREGLLQNVLIANPNDTIKFAASGSSAPLNVFAASMTLPELSDEARESFLRYCLELKMIFPSLHNPNCFGAHPNPEKCRKSICALDKNRKGGCR